MEASNFTDAQKGLILKQGGQRCCYRRRIRHTDSLNFKLRLCLTFSNLDIMVAGYTKMVVL